MSMYDQSYKCERCKINSEIRNLEPGILHLFVYRYTQIRINEIPLAWLNLPFE